MPRLLQRWLGQGLKPDAPRLRNNRIVAFAGGHEAVSFDVMRTILMELDLRRPSLAATLGITGAGSFSQVLQGRAGFGDAAYRYGDGLAIAPNAGPVRNPAELLHGSSVPTALALIEANYAPDVMLFDMPPMLVSDDAMVLMGQVDAVLLVAAAETTTVKEIDACERELASQTNVMGVVLNKCRYMGPEYGYSLRVGRV